MLKLNVNEAKQLTFEAQIGGVNGDQINSFFRIVIEDVEYGFPAQVGNESITVNLPPLNKVVGKKIKEGAEAEVRLEIIADGHYLTPWSDKVKMSNPLIIEAKIKDDDFSPPPSLKTEVAISEDGAKDEPIIKEDITDKIVNKLSEKFAELIKPAVEAKNDTVKVVNEVFKPANKKEVKEDVPLTSSSMEKILAQTISKLGLYTEEKKKDTKKKVTLEQFKKKLTREDVYKYINRAGTKNPQIQEIVYEQAVSVAKNNSPIEVLRQVINIMKKNKS